MAYDSERLKDIVGQTVVEINGMKEGSERVTFITKEGNKLVLWYEQDCCASCDINQIDGDPLDLLGSPMVMAEEVTGESIGVDDSKDTEGKDENDGYGNSFTWTFYKFATIYGYVTLRWFGSSNGYYSESTSVWYGPKDKEESRW